MSETGLRESSEVEPGVEQGPDQEIDQSTGPGADSARLLLAALARLRPFWPWIVLALLTWIGWQDLRLIDVDAVRLALRGTSGGLLLALLAATSINMAVFGLYDLAALGPLSRPPAAGARWTVGVVSFAWSNFLTVGPMAGPALRLWLYRPLGVESKRARSALGSILIAFSLALLAWCAAVLLPLPASLDSFAARIALGALLGLLAAGVLAGMPRLRLSPPSIRAWEGNPLALAAISMTDWLVSWGVFHLALTGFDGGLDPVLSLSAFFIGQLIGLASFVPGGLGSADAWWLLSLGTVAGGHDKVLAALLLYRCIYYVLPWAFATLALAGRLIRTGRRTGGFLRTAAASYAFLCGTMLLASAATPALTERAGFLRTTVPLALIEVSHGASIALGFLLLVISRGLARGYRSSHRLALAFYLAGALTTFLKGLDFEEALLSLSAAVFLVFFHRSFERSGRLRPPAEFLLSVAAFAVVLFTAVGLGSLSSSPDVPDVLSQFGDVSHEARFARGLLLLVSMGAVVALHFTLRARPAEPLPGDTDIDRAMADVRSHSRSTNPLLVACGDKAIFRPAPSSDPPKGSAADRGFICYRTAGRFLVAYSDPVCPPGAQRELLASFLDHAASSDQDVILYQISAGFLPVAHDFGFSFFKLGEEAIVDLHRFNLKGDKAKSWRHAINSVEKEGGTFEIQPGEAVEPLLPDLRRISDDWLKEKHVAEKRFSIGRFSEPYLRRFPCAILRDAGGRIVAFANVLEGGQGGELSIDLMRYSAALEREARLRNVMDYLLLKLMLHGQSLGYSRFNLGMAPLAEVGVERWARPFEKLAHQFFRHGEQWYNYKGLRRYKEKFDPSWEPRYMAYPRPWDWPLAVTSTAVLVAGGWRGLFFPREESA
jgi:phosphatidylglycerol lysyltransferase